MSNPFDDIRNAISAAREAQRAVANHSHAMAQLLAGNLRNMWSADTLRTLKKELRDFDMVTGTWKK